MMGGKGGMDRRQFLTVTTGSATALLAGCAGDSSEGSTEGSNPDTGTATVLEETGTDTPTETATESPTPTATPNQDIGQRIYEATLPEGGDEVVLFNGTDRKQLDIVADQAMDGEYGEAAANAEDGVDAIRAVHNHVLGEIAIPDTHIAMQYFVHNNIGFPEEYFSVSGGGEAGIE